MSAENRIVARDPASEYIEAGCNGGGKVGSDADYQRVLRNPDPDVLERLRPPHFHALYADHEVLIDIRTLDILEGEMPRRALALILEWAQEHRAELMEGWELCAHNQKPNTIRPLA